MTEGLFVYGPLLATLLFAYSWVRHRANRRSLVKRDEAVASGLSEPASLHPTFDTGLCLECGACVRACPEGDVIGLIGGKPELIEPSACIGHGACHAVCPFGAITLVFGTEKRGVDIPHVNPDFETNVPGLFIAGELGGMGLIRNAIEQGRQAIDAVRKLGGLGQRDRLDLVIVGAGPAGLSASLAALESKLNFVTLEQDTLGGTVAHFPRGKVVMTAPATLPIVGKVKFREVSKEKLLAFWHDVVRKTRLSINFNERVEKIEPMGDEFAITTHRGVYRARAVLLAIGRRGTPRKLGVPGEDLPHVVYRLSDSAQYRGKHVLVVGGGDSAIEAAVSISGEPGTKVTLSYRGDGFGRAKVKNRKAIDAAVAKGKIDLMFGSNVTRILGGLAEIERQGRGIQIRNDAVIVCAGGILPTPFLKSMGIEVETKYGTR